MIFLNIPSNYDFLRSLYKYIVDNFDNDIDMSFVDVFLPSRRSVNELKKIFLENSNKKSIILPNIKAIGDIDYDEILSLDYDNIEKYLDITKSTSTIKYKLLLIEKLIEENINIDQAINLANELSNFFQEVEQQELNLDDLENIVDDEYSLHWQKILKFLKVFGKKWNKFLNENNIISKNKNSLINLKFYKDSFKNKKPKNPIIFAGIFTDIKITNELIKTLSVYDNTYYFMKGYIKDCIADEIDSNYYYNNIIKYLDIKNIKNIEYEEYKTIDSVDLINKAMSNYSLTNNWHNNKDLNNLDNIKYFECDNIYEEIDVITLYLLDYIAKNSLNNIAIISTDEYSHLIELNLKKYNLPINNAFGNKYINNNFVKYFLLIIQCYIDEFKKEVFIDLLNNERISFGYNKEELNNYKIELKENIFVYSLNDDNIDFYKLKGNNELNIFLDKILEYYSIFKEKDSFSNFLNNHIALLKNISFDLKDEDLEIIDFINKNILSIDLYKNIDVETYFKLISYIFSQQSYSENYSKNKAINIISQQEARLINYDLVILFNMNDGVFPRNIATDPWMSKSMRKSFGLLSIDIEIGKSAHDFIQLISQKNVVITRSKKVAGNISFESRFLQRIKTLLACNKLKLNTDNKIKDIYKLINEIEEYNYKAKRPEPCPDKKYRLMNLSPTLINTFIKNPYDIYAQYILKLYETDVFENYNLNLAIGNLIHKILERYENEKPKNCDNIINEELNNLFLNNKTMIRLYYDKVKVAFDNFIRIRKERHFESVLTENRFFVKLNDFNISAKIDRIEKKFDNIIDIVDYKTGGEKKDKDVENLREIQLPLEYYILNKNNYKVSQFEYWYINFNKQEVKSFNSGNFDLKIIENRLITIIDAIKNSPFIATNKNGYSNFTHLSRVDEWLGND